MSGKIVYSQVVRRRDAILKRWGDAVDAIIDVGKALIEAREVLSDEHYAELVESLPFGIRTSQRLMAIARNQWLATHVSQLPPYWGTLYELSRFEDKDLDWALEHGYIHAAMNRKEATALARIQDDPPAAAVPLEQVALDGRKYGAILADPPWPFETWSAGGKDRSPERHYPTLSIDEIARLPVGELAAEDCALFLWVLSASAREAVEVIIRWGFEFKTVAFVWVKEGNGGLGYWTRQRAEACLLATRGQPKRLNADVDQVITAPRREHSRKPDEVYTRVERLVAGPYLELFARQSKPGWDCWGNQTEKFDAGTG